MDPDNFCGKSTKLNAELGMRVVMHRFDLNPQLDPILEIAVEHIQDLDLTLRNEKGVEIAS